jgi:hypothetical protein
MATEIVERVKSETWTNRDGEDVTSYRVTLVSDVGQREVPCYDPRGKDLIEDAPVPDGWEVKTSKAGKLYLAAPKAAISGGFRSSGAPAAWRNTEPGAKYEQERMDRRTALMQAAEMQRVQPDRADWWELSNQFYAWLRQSVSAPRVVAGGTSEAVAAPARAPGGEAVKPGEVGADTPSDGGGDDRSYRDDDVKARTASPPSDTTCHCGQAWGPNTTATGKRVCVGGHVEKFDA